MQAVLNYLDKHEAKFVERLCEYVRFPSVSAQPQHKKDLAACAERMVNECREAGLETELCPTSGNPIIRARTPRRAGSGRVFVFRGHYDVQPGEPFDLWKSPPFEPRIEGR